MDIKDIIEINEEIKPIFGEIVKAVAEILSENLKIRKPSGPVETGYCLTCGEPLPAGRRWCDASCRDEWEGEKWATGKGNAGKPEMIAAARKLIGREPIDDNESDAVMIAAWAACEYCWEGK